MKLGFATSLGFSALSGATTALSAFSDSLLPSWSYTTPVLMTISAAFLMVAGVAFTVDYMGARKL